MTDYDFSKKGKVKITDKESVKESKPVEDITSQDNTTTSFEYVAEDETSLSKKVAYYVAGIATVIISSLWVYDSFIANPTIPQTPIKSEQEIVKKLPVVVDTVKTETIETKVEEPILDNYSTTEKPTFSNYISSDKQTAKILKYMQTQNVGVIILEDDAQKIKIKKFSTNKNTGLRYTYMPKENLDHPDLIYKNMTILTDYIRDGEIDATLEYILKNGSREKFYFINKTATQCSQLAKDMGISNLEQSDEYQHLGLKVREKSIELINKK